MGKLEFNRLTLYMTVISIFGLVIILLNPPILTNFLQIDNLLFLILAIIASNTSIQFKSGINMTLTSPVAIFLLLTQDMSTAVYIGSIGLLSYQIATRKSISRIIFNVAQFTISIYAAGIFLYYFYTDPLQLPSDLIPIIPAILILEFVNLGLVSKAISIVSGKPTLSIFIDGFKETQVGMPLYLTNGLIMYICYHGYGLWGLVLVVIPLFSVNWLLQATKNANLHKENSHICPTTNLKNKRSFNYWICEQFQDTIRNNQNISFILIDIDDFKRVNDQYGHDVGDQVLGEFGTLLAENTRDTDLIFRYGGEEFVIVLPGYRLEQAHAVIERLRTTIQFHPFTHTKLTITFSAGISSLDQDLLNDHKLSTPDELIRRADMAMYTAKQSGKNQIKYYGT